MSLEAKTLINSLTDDNDYRQDLWVFFLSGNSLTSLPEHLEFLKLSYSIQSSLPLALNELQSSSYCVNILSSFTPLESSIIQLLMLGLTIDEIAKYKRVSFIRVIQAIDVIKCRDEVWSEFDK